MRKWIFLLCLGLFAICSTATAQVNEAERGMSQGVNNALSINMPNVDEKRVADVWKDFMKEYKSRPKYDRKNKEYLSDDAKITAIGSGNTVDVYASITERSDDVEFTVWFDLGGAYLSSNRHPDRYEEAEKMVLTFAIEVARSLVQDELDEEQKALKQLESTLSKLKRDNESYHKEIENAKERIARAESDIEKNISDQEKMQKDIEKQVENLNKVQRKLDDL